jgi:hypothetical protein
MREEPMKALSIRAPWWWAILHGKPVLSMNDAGFGARLITKGQHFDVYNGLNFVVTVQALAVTRNGSVAVKTVARINPGYIARVMERIKRTWAWKC